MGYRSFWKVLNAKDYGVPQNRERVFVVSILGGGQYQFPEPIKLTKRLKDVLEPVVDEKYYLSDKLINGFLNRMDKSDGGFAREINIRDKESYASALTARMAKCGITDNYIEEPMCCASRGRNPENPSDRTTGSPTEQRLELNETGCSNTLTSVQKDNYVLEPSINVVGNYTESGHEASRILKTDGIYPTVKENHGTVPAVIEPSVKQVGNICNTSSFGGNPQIGRVYSSDGCSPTLNTCQGGGHEPKITEMYNPYNKTKIKDVAPTQTSNCDKSTSSSAVIIKYDNYRIRKLTPRECWRLMGVRDEQFDKLHDISNSQLYKMAGNSIVVDVLMGIFRNLFIDKDQKGQLQLL